MRRVLRALPVLWLALGLAPTASAHPEAPTFGMEFEFAGFGDWIVGCEETPYESDSPALRRMFNPVRGGGYEHEIARGAQQRVRRP